MISVESYHCCYTGFVQSYDDERVVDLLVRVLLSSFW